MKLYRNDAPPVGYQIDFYGNPTSIPGWEFAIESDVDTLIEKIKQDIGRPFIKILIPTISNNPAFQFWMVIGDKANWPEDKNGSEGYYTAGELLSKQFLYAQGNGKWVFGDKSLPMPNWRLDFEWESTNEFVGWNGPQYK